VRAWSVREHPFGAGASGIAPPFPVCDRADGAFWLGAAAVEAVGAQHARRDLDHVPVSISSKLSQRGCGGSRAGAAGGALRRPEKLHPSAGAPSRRTGPCSVSVSIARASNSGSGARRPSVGSSRRSPSGGLPPCPRAPRTAARLLAQGCFQFTLDEAALGPAHRRTADAKRSAPCPSSLSLGGGGQQDLRQLVRARLAQL
jgi:hypothetical protein